MAMPWWGNNCDDDLRTELQEALARDMMAHLSEGFDQWS